MIKGLADLEPRGLTPLAAATNLITAKIVPMAPGLMKNNQRVCVVIATDGEPSDKGFQAALGRLQALPVWVVVRTCTDEDSVIDYYNDLDAEMEAPMEVLDDLLGEAHEVCQLNRWCATLAPSSATAPATYQSLPIFIHPWPFPLPAHPPACAYRACQADVRTAVANRSRKCPFPTASP